jgi:Cof subfamily protein (haloacid dehalogenase superfamily)
LRKDKKPVAMVVSDLDGTLLLDNDRISPAVLETRRCLNDKKILFTIATGRGWSQTAHIAAELGVTIPLAVQSGALIVRPENGKILQSSLVPYDISCLIWDLRDKVTDFFALNLEGDYCNDGIRTDEGRRLEGFLKEKNVQVDKFWSVPQEGVVKFLCVGSPEDVMRMSRRIEAIYPELNQIIWRERQHGWYLELFSPQANKANAVRSIAAKYGVEMEQIMAFGDGENDRELLMEVGWGCAINNAPWDIRRKAWRTVPGPYKDGVAQAVSRWVLQSPAEGSWLKRFMTFIPTRS